MRFGGGGQGSDDGGRLGVGIGQRGNGGVCTPGPRTSPRSDHWGTVTSGAGGNAAARRRSPRPTSRLTCHDRIPRDPPHRHRPRRPPARRNARRALQRRPSSGTRAGRARQRDRVVDGPCATGAAEDYGRRCCRRNCLRPEPEPSSSTMPCWRRLPTSRIAGRPSSPRSSSPSTRSPRCPHGGVVPSSDVVLDGGVPLTRFSPPGVDSTGTGHQGQSGCLSAPAGGQSRGLRRSGRTGGRGAGRAVDRSAGRGRTPPSELRLEAGTADAASGCDAAAALSRGSAAQPALRLSRRRSRSLRPPQMPNRSSLARA